MATTTETSALRTTVIFAAVCVVLVAIGLVTGLGGRSNEGDTVQAGPDDAADPAAARGESTEIPAALSRRAGSGGAGELIPGRAEDPGAAAADEQSGSESGRRSIAIPAEFAQLFADGGELAEFHTMLESEARDDVWAFAIEQFLEAHLNSTLDLSRYNLASLECRATACEVLALGYGEDALRGWMRSATGLFEDEDALAALLGGPGSASCGGGDFAPGITALHCTFVRSDPVLEDEPAPEPFPLDAPYPDDVNPVPVDVADPVKSTVESSLEIYNLHRRLEQEVPDYEWSNYNESLIVQYLAELESAQSMTVHSVVCRSTLCEVQMSAPDEAAFIEWLPDMIDFQRLDWHELTTAGFDGGPVVAGEPVGYVWFLERGQP